MRRCHLVILLVVLGGFIVPGLVAAQPNVTGQWVSIAPLPYFPVHAHVLPTGKVMVWPGDGVSGNDPRLWDPATQTVSILNKPGYDTFCSGHVFLADGRLFVAGGHILNSVGLANASIYNPFTGAWTALPPMNVGRWYPTTTILPNGDVLVVSGSIDLTVGNNPLPQVFQLATGTWRDLTTAQLIVEAYPTLFVAPNGKIFMAGPTTTTRYLDTAGTGAWTVVAERVGPLRDTGSAVMYANGKILTMGGGDPPTNTAEVIDLNQPSPAWRAVAPMQFARRQLNAVLLPDGKVLVTGGTSGPGFNDPGGAVFPAELWDPATEQWTTLASATIPRLYHSTTVLLPDGRVLSMGGDGFPDTEIFSPPYLFKGARPSITSAPANVTYGQPFFVGTPDTANVTKVTMLRLSSTTHAFNINQRISQLSFSVGTGGLNVTAPANAVAAPPGHYLLFLLNGSGVPSVASIVQLGGPAGPTLSALIPDTIFAGHPGGVLTVTGTNFVNGAVVRWNGAARSTTFLDSTQLQAVIPGSDVATAGMPPVTVVNPDGGTSNPLTFTVTGPGPTLSSLTPSSVSVGNGALTLTLAGTNFVSGSIVRWNGASRTTFFNSPTQVQALLSGSDFATAGPVPVTVVNPDGATSNALTFTVSGGPTLTSIAPNLATAGGAAFTLTVNGTNFVSGSVVRWNGTNRTTTFVNATKLTASITAANIATAGTAQVTVANPDGSTSNALPFTINPASPSAPTVSSLAPNSATAGGAAFTLTVNGTNFVSGAIVRWNGTNRTTSFVSATKLTASITAANIATVGTAQVTVVNPDGSTSNAVPFAITGPAPSLSALVPNSIFAGHPGGILTLNGANFVNGAIVRWNGQNRTTTFVSSTQLQAAIPGSDVAAQGTAPVTVVNPDGKVSNALTFTITP